jgi:hypothetical protein
VHEKAKGGTKAGTTTRWHVLQFVKPTDIVNNSTYSTYKLALLVFSYTSRVFST